ncbi:mirror-image polydactyly gene 1 protein-like isoform X5 [Salmo trutta]|uniref:mirror-image polydactyly gene 1 protein-like isoform X4 n=1 Tax=Salmo trutta TaxID=8032 RepID=UPI00112FDDAF|nr:mirror-image polydactyly gene 1 protein-like isoform X4 [Salmo trutta]XP_029568900.1 mirror-image polydactyly gene 1 protein-like isoform X5 [Salmo trutta]XP_029568901.1 mirror-image polydactyly gene 1 protein-like isoform X5 [Salmo trutta]
MFNEQIPAKMLLIFLLNFVRAYGEAHCLSLRHLSERREELAVDGSLGSFVVGLTKGSEDIGNPTICWFSALVEEIYQSQRDRDQAAMAWLCLSNEERDEALLRAKRLQQAAAELEDINPEGSDTDLEELLNSVTSANSTLGIERSAAVIVDRLQKAQERRRKITAKEISVVIEERDRALARVGLTNTQLL